MERTWSIHDLRKTLIELENEYYILNDQYVQLKSICNNNYKKAPILQYKQPDGRNRDNSTSKEVTGGSKMTINTQKASNSKLSGEVNYSKLVQDRIKSFYSTLNTINNCKIKSEEKYAFLNNLEENFI